MLRLPALPSPTRAALPSLCSERRARRGPFNPERFPSAKSPSGCSRTAIVQCRTFYLEPRSRSSSTKAEIQGTAHPAHPLRPSASTPPSRLLHVRADTRKKVAQNVPLALARDEPGPRTRASPSSHDGDGASARRANCCPSGTPPDLISALLGCPTAGSPKVNTTNVMLPRAHHPHHR